MLLFLPCSSENVSSSSEVSEESKVEAHPTVERCNQSKFLGVAELSSNGERSSGFAVVDMVNSNSSFCY